MTSNQPLFPHGRLLATQIIMERFEAPQLIVALNRHLKGDWGDLDDEDKAANDRALEDGTRLFSSYNLPGGKIWIITEADRSATTILLPEEY